MRRLLICFGIGLFGSSVFLIPIVYNDTHPHSLPWGSVVTAGVGLLFIITGVVMQRRS